MSGGKDWADREITVAVHMRSTGAPVKEIAKVLDRSSGAIQHKLQEVRCMTKFAHASGKNSNSPLRKKCIALRDVERLSASQIAARLGISRNAVIGHWRRDNMLRGKFAK